MTARRPLITAVVAGTVLSALWFVPTADATPEPAAPRSVQEAPGAVLADTGGVDTTPYVIGGLAFVTAGGALVTTAVRASRRPGAHSAP
ncbi:MULTISPECIES: hypothetical protein [Streptomyces]|uniref:LPXTG cell wall anchor domain-containing protein n=1 Tax=Streptomyces luteosporeus TaxID=173856 RepID=A0ABN3U7U7_9ACTN